MRKIHFPRLAIPAAVVLTAVFNLGLNMVAVATFFVIGGVPVRWSWLQLPVPAAVRDASSRSAWRCCCRRCYVRYRDVRPIWDVILQIIFYASPVLYVIERIDIDWLRELIMHTNPLAPLLRAGTPRDDRPRGAERRGGDRRSVAAARSRSGSSCGLFVLGLYVFSRAAPRIAEDL